jgi:hypothetical protein
MKELLRALYRPQALVVAVLAVALVGFWQAASEKASQRPSEVDPRLAEADAASKEAIDRRLEGVCALFDRARAGARPFAEDALSWSGKLAFTKDLIGVGDQEHAQFLRQAFIRHVLNDADIDRVLNAAIKGYLSDLEGIESEMLVKLRADLDGVCPEEAPPYLRSEDAFRREYTRLSEELGGRLRKEAMVTVGRETGLFVGTDVATQAAVQAARAAATELGIEGGILSSGAASSAATLGTGLVVAVALDYVLDELMKAAGYDPVGDIEADVLRAMDKMEEALFVAVAEQMLNVHEARGVARRDVVEALKRSKR